MPLFIKHSRYIHKSKYHTRNCFIFQNYNFHSLINVLGSQSHYFSHKIPNQNLKEGDYSTTNYFKATSSYRYCMQYFPEQKYFCLDKGKVCLSMMKPYSIAYKRIFIHRRAKLAKSSKPISSFAI